VNLQPKRGMSRMLIEGPEVTESLTQDQHLTVNSDSRDDSRTAQHNSGVLLLGSMIFCVY